MTRRVDVFVLGAGPAGATIARLLALEGCSVLLLRGPQSRNPHAGSLPPAIGEVFDTIGIRNGIDAAHFYPDLGVTRWWGESSPEVETYSGRSGYHVHRQQFDELLLRLAEQAGAVVARNRSAPRLDLDAGIVEHDGGVTQARFMVDATGRAGLLARQIRRFWDPRYRTMGLCGLLRAKSHFPADPHHNLMEAYDRGWVWSVPLSPRCRYVCAYVDASVAREGEAPFRAELERTVEFRRLCADAELEAPPWARDASLYYSERYAGRNWLLVGDAASFADTLSSFGIEKALVSAREGAAAILDCLRRPSAAPAALAAFDARERATWLDHADRASAMYARMTACFDTPFWHSRSGRVRIAPR